MEEVGDGDINSNVDTANGVVNEFKNDADDLGDQHAGIGMISDPGKNTTNCLHHWHNTTQHIRSNTSNIKQTRIIPRSRASFNDRGYISTPIHNTTNISNNIARTFVFFKFRLQLPSTPQ